MIQKGTSWRCSSSPVPDLRPRSWVSPPRPLNARRCWGPCAVSSSMSCGVPSFPSRGSAKGETDVLTALDASSQVMCIELLDSLDADALVAAMARTAVAAQSGWSELASRYPGGSAAFRDDWDEFREAVPINAGQGPRLTLIALGVHEEVRAALAMLLCSGIEVQEAQVRTAPTGASWSAGAGAS